MDFEPFQFNDAPQGELPTVEVVEDSVAKVSNTPKKKKEPQPEKTPTLVKEQVVQKVEIIQSARWFKPEAVGREKLTTYIKGQLIEDLKMMALKKKISLADLIEKILLDN